MSVHGSKSVRMDFYESQCVKLPSGIVFKLSERDYQQKLKKKTA